MPRSNLFSLFKGRDGLYYTVPLIQYKFESMAYNNAVETEDIAKILYYETGETGWKLLKSLKD